MSASPMGTRLKADGYYIGAAHGLSQVFCCHLLRSISWQLWLFVSGLRLAGLSRRWNRDRRIECAQGPCMTIAHAQAEQVFSRRKIERLAAGKRLLLYALIFLRLERSDHRITEGLH